MSRLANSRPAPAARLKKGGEAVADAAKSYADRGVFRSFDRQNRPGGNIEFRFLWLNSAPVRMVWNGRSSTLAFQDYLPDVPARSEMYRELNEFVKERTSAKLPAHRRIDPRRVGVGCVNRRGNVSIQIKVKGSNHGYATTRGIHLINELYMGFLHNRYHDYLVRNFAVPEE
jgi:hypothetical protein